MIKYYNILKYIVTIILQYSINLQFIIINVTEITKTNYEHCSLATPHSVHNLVYSVLFNSAIA